MERLLIRYFDGEISEEEFEKLFDYIKENGLDWMEPTLRAQWETIHVGSVIPLFNKEELFAKIQASKKNRKPLPVYLYRVAASILIVSIVSISLFLRKEGKVELKEYTYNTAQSVKLPDGSLVLIKENSKLRFKDWQKDAPREVWLEGKAFFKVEKTPGRSNPKFIVHTVNLDVQVLGTKFSVETSKTNTKVALKSGKVRLIKNKRTVDMDPGELVVYESTSRVFNTKEINIETYPLLEEKVISFENESLFNVTQKLKKSFGVKIILLDDSLRNKYFTGEANGDDMESFYSVLEEVFEVQVKKLQDGSVELSKKKNEN